MPIRAVIFDLFDTLVDLQLENIPVSVYRGRKVPDTVERLHAAVADCADVDFETFLHTIGAVDQEFRRSRYARDLELPTIERFETVVSRLEIDAPDLPERLCAIHMRGIREQVREIDHHPGVLAGLASRVRIGLCSNFSHSPTALAVLDAASLSEHFDAVVISDAVGIRKPRGEIFEATLEALDVAPDEALHVGDSLTADIGGAAAAGIQTAWITRRVRDPDAKLAEFAGPPPDFRVADLAELSELLDRADPAA